MTDRFQRLGIDYRFAPSEVPAVLVYQRIKDKDESFVCQLAVCTEQGERVMTRRIDLLAGFTGGALLSLTKELNELNRATSVDEWKTLLREGNESVIRAHRKGRPFLRTQGIIERPPPPPWLCQGLLRKNKPNCWLGAASTGKSTLAKAMCAYYASGHLFCDRVMEQGVPLYLDWEDDFDSFNRTVYDVCRNLGVWPLPLMMWRDMHGYRMRNQLEALAEVIEREHVGLLVLDAVAAAGGATGENAGWESIALEMEDCLGILPPVTVLALDHVTGAEHRAQRNGGPTFKPPVPIKARGAERKLEYLRNQWSLVTDIEAEEGGRHVVEWTHTKNSHGPKERPGFSTEIVHGRDDIEIRWQPLAEESGFTVSATDSSKTGRLLAELELVTAATASELAWRLDGAQPTRSSENSVRILLERAVTRGLVTKEPDDRGRMRYSRKQSTQNGVVVDFPVGPREP